MENQKTTKRIVLNIDGIGTYAGEIVWNLKQTLRHAAKDLGLDLKHWEIADHPRETKSSLTYTVTRKQAAGTAEATDSQTVAPIVKKGPAPIPKRRPDPVAVPQTFEDSYHWLIGHRLDESAPYIPAYAPTPVEAPVALSTHAAPEPPPFDFEDSYHWLIGQPLQKPAGKPAPAAQVIRLERSELLDALKIAVTIAEAKGNLPITSNVLLRSNGTECLVLATDLDRSWWRTLGSLGDEVTACVPAKLLQIEVKALPADIRVVELAFLDGKCTINGRCDLFTGEVEEFPEIKADMFDEAEPIRVRGLLDALKRVAPAISTDETRYVLTGAFLDLPRQTVVGTNGFCLFFDEVVCASDQTAIVPNATVKLLTKYGCGDTIHLMENRIAFPSSGGVLSSRLIESHFPDYSGILGDLDNRFDYTIEFGAAEFIKLMEGANPLAEGSIDLKINGALQIESGMATGEYRWQIPCTRKGKDGDLLISFNPELLMNAIRSYPADRITLKAPETYGMCLINGKAAVMPLRK